MNVTSPSSGVEALSTTLMPPGDGICLEQGVRDKRTCVSRVSDLIGLVAFRLRGHTRVCFLTWGNRQLVAICHPEESARHKPYAPTLLSWTLQHLVLWENKISVVEITHLVVFYDSPCRLINKWRSKNWSSELWGRLICHTQAVNTLLEGHSSNQKAFCLVSHICLSTFIPLLKFLFCDDLCKVPCSRVASRHRKMLWPLPCLKV